MITTLFTLWMNFPHFYYAILFPHLVIFFSTLYYVYCIPTDLNDGIIIKNKHSCTYRLQLCHRKINLTYIKVALFYYRCIILLPIRYINRKYMY